MSYCFNPDCLQPNNPIRAEFCSSCRISLLLRDRYRGLKIIGQGSMGRTFLGVERKNSRQEVYCVIKQLYAQDRAGDKPFSIVDILNKLGQHPQIPQLYDYFSLDKHQYIVQEWIEGDNLQQLTAKKGILNERGVTQLLVNLLPVVGYIHQFDIIHRDIKPENIICSSNGKLVLVDLGAFEKVVPSLLHQTRNIIGSPEYIAPEQLRGKATVSSDIYSLGVTCLYLLTGISPFDLYSDGEDTWVWRDYLGENSIDDRLAQAIDKMIARRTYKRYQSTQEVLRDLDKIDSSSAIALHNINPILSSPTTILPEAKIDYAQLKSYLEAQNWQKANQETEKLLLLGASQERRDWFERDDLENLACRDLQIINELWHDYSNGHFGFRVQSQIWQDLQVKNYQNFGKEVGWYVRQRWLRKKSLIFSLCAPKGHLPAVSWWFGHAIWGLKNLFMKINCCQEQAIADLIPQEQNNFLIKENYYSSIYSKPK